MSLRAVRLTSAPLVRSQEVVMTNPTREELFKLTAFARCAG